MSKLEGLGNLQIDDFEANGQALTPPDDDDAEPIWAYGGLRKDVFYASLAFFDNKYPTQMTEYVIPKDGTPVRISESSNTTKLLDQLALLFARFKKSKLPLNIETDGLFPSSTGQNVTAAALQWPDGQKWTIHLTKNDGPLEFDGQSDKTMLKNIETWYSSLRENETSLPGQEHEIWQSMQRFWLRRTSYYFERLKELQVKLIIEIEDGTSGLLELLLDMYKECDGHAASEMLDKASCESCRSRKSGIETDMKHVLELLKALTLDDVSEEAVHAYVHHLWFEDPLAWERRYPKIQPSDRRLWPDNNNKMTLRKRKDGRDRRYKQVNRFRNAVKYLSLTMTPRLVLDRLLRFKQIYPYKQLAFNFFDAKQVRSIRAEVITGALNSTWGSEMAKSSKKFKTHLKNTSNSLHAEDEAKDFPGRSGQLVRRKEEGIHRYFHCELQMLDKFLDATDVHEYFGCSKLSCYLCWCVLVGSNTKYRTNYTHRKIEINSAFQFSYSEDRDQRFRSLADALKTIETHLCDYIAEKARQGDKDYYITANSGASDTYLEYTTTGQAKLVSQVGVEFSDSDEERDRGELDQDHVDDDWHKLRHMLLYEASHLKIHLLSELPQKKVNAIRIPRADEPEFCDVTVYDMSQWGPCDPAWGWVPLESHQSKLWYPDYQLESSMWRSSGHWHRQYFGKQYFVDFFRYMPSGNDWPNKVLHHQWWLRETGNPDITPAGVSAVQDIYIGSCKEDLKSLKVSSQNLRSIVNKFRKCAKEDLLVQDRSRLRSESGVSSGFTSS